MQRIRRTAALIVSVVVFCYCAPARAEGVLDQVPADALVVVKINRLEATNQKAGKWTEALGLAQLSPDAANPLGALENKLNIKQGLDRSGDLAFVFLDPDKAGGAKAAPKADAADADADAGEHGGNHPDQSMLILVPTTDYKAFVGNLQNAKTAGNVTTFKPDEDGPEVHVANWGKYAVLSPSRALVQNKPQGGMKLSGLAAKEMQEKDVVIYANMPAIKAKALPQLQKLRQEMKKQLSQQQAGAPDAEPADDAAATPAPPVRRPAPANRAAPARRPGTPGARGIESGDAAAVQAVALERQDDADAQPARNAKSRQPAAGANGGNPAMAQSMAAMVDQYFAFAERFLNDSQAATIGLSLSDDGLNTTTMAEFTPNSYMGNLAQGLKNSDQPLMAGLPDRKYFAFGGMVNSPKALNQILDDVMQPLIKQAKNGQDKANAAGDPQELLTAGKQVIDNAKTFSFGYAVPTGAMGAESVVQAVTVVTGNAKAIAEAERKVMKNIGVWFQNMPQAGGGPAPQMSFEMDDAGKTVGGVKLDSFKFNIEMDAQNNPQAAQAQQMMSMIYGPNGLSGVMGAVGDNTFLAVQGGTDKLIADAVASSKNAQDVLSKSAPVQAVRGTLPKQRLAEFYISLDQIISSAVKYAQGFGAPVKMQLPQGLPPIGITAASEGTAVRVDSHVPTTLVQSVVAGVMQAYMQMQGGGAGAPDGL